jgi:hypothetical protein
LGFPTGRSFTSSTACQQFSGTIQHRAINGQVALFPCLKPGIKVNPGKICAIEKMKPPKDLKEVQKFTGCLASLSRFISRLGEKALPLYQLMKKFDTFV